MDITYHMPVKVMMEKGIVIKKHYEFKGFGKKAFIITGKSSSKINGSLEDVEAALDKEGIDYYIFDRVEENPSLETIEDASKIGLEQNVDFIIGVGGGSPIDAAKAIAVMIKNPQLNKDNLITPEKLEALDVIAIPTTSGTGTEVTQYSVLTDHKNKTKRNLGQEVFPKLALLDPKYTEKMDLDTTVSTAIDALSHIIEGYLNRHANDITDALAERGIKIWGECKDDLVSGDIKNTSREKLMIASNIGGMIIAQTGTSLPHGMSYPLTYHKGISHGFAIGSLYKEYLKIFKDRKKVNKIYELLGLESHKEFEELMDKLVKVHIHVTQDEIKKYTDEVWENKEKLANHPEDILYEELFFIYTNSLLYI